MLPDSLQEVFRGRGLVIVQTINGTTAFSPRGIKLFDAGVHAGNFNGCSRPCQAESSLGATEVYFTPPWPNSCAAEGSLRVELF
jgi:hypothetical protein